MNVRASGRERLEGPTRRGRHAHTGKPTTRDTQRVPPTVPAGRTQLGDSMRGWEGASFPPPHTPTPPSTGGSSTRAIGDADAACPCPGRRGRAQGGRADDSPLSSRFRPHCVQPQSCPRARRLCTLRTKPPNPKGASVNRGRVGASATPTPGHRCAPGARRRSSLQPSEAARARLVVVPRGVAAPTA